jgi:hypothetical protein
MAAFLFARFSAEIFFMAWWVKDHPQMDSCEVNSSQCAILAA